jgi:Ca2+-transporting ATPase
LARELVPGDLVSLSMGDRVPADVRIIDAVDLQIDESSFTGENEPRHKHSKQLASPDHVGIEHLDNVAFMGTLISSGRGKVGLNVYQTLTFSLFRVWLLERVQIHDLARFSK